MSNAYQYDVLVFIGRFQPFHVGHLMVILEALKLARHVVILIGSSYQPRTIKNPFKWTERCDMIRDSVPREDWDRISVRPIRDIKYNDERWAQQVQSVVESAIASNAPLATKVGVIGHNKDESSYYLRMFPQWGEPVEHKLNEMINATDLRKLYFDGMILKYLRDVVPESVYQWLHTFRDTESYNRLVVEWEFQKKHDKAWEAAPYPPSFMAADAVVVQSAHILLVERRSAPGEGLLALPGGYVNQAEWTRAAAIRELREECKIKVPEPVLIGSIKERHLFEDPNRSERKRMYSMSYYIELPPGKLPRVRGADDARRALWLPLNEVNEEEMFEDHFHIINYFVG